MAYRNVALETIDVLNNYSRIKNNEVNFKIYEFRFGEYVRVRKLYLKVQRIDSIECKDSFGNFIRNLYLEDDSGAVYDCVYGLSYLVSYYNLQVGDIVEVIRRC